MAFDVAFQGDCQPAAAMLPALASGALIHRFATSDRVEELEKPTSGRGVVQALFKRLAVLDAAQDIHAVRTQGMHRAADIVDAELFDQKICCEVTADRDHELAKLRHRARLPNRLVQVRFRVITGIEPVDRSGLEGGSGRPVLSQIGRPIRRTACGGLWAVGRGAHNTPDWKYIAAQ